LPGKGARVPADESADCQNALYQEPRFNPRSFASFREIPRLKNVAGFKGRALDLESREIGTRGIARN